MESSPRTKMKSWELIWVPEGRQEDREDKEKSCLNRGNIRRGGTRMAKDYECYLML